MGLTCKKSINVIDHIYRKNYEYLIKERKNVWKFNNFDVNW